MTYLYLFFPFALFEVEIVLILVFIFTRPDEARWEWFVELFAFEARLAARERETEEDT
jgi:hypothetical protein